jgi:hypothetical protein
VLTSEGGSGGRGGRPWRPTSLWRRRWLHWLLPGVRLEVVHRHCLLSVAHLQPEHLLSSLLDRVGPRVQRRQVAASPHVDARACRQRRREPRLGRQQGPVRVGHPNSASL